MAKKKVGKRGVKLTDAPYHRFSPKCRECESYEIVLTLLAFNSLARIYAECFCLDCEHEFATESEYPAILAWCLETDGITTKTKPKPDEKSDEDEDNIDRAEKSRIL